MKKIALYLTQDEMACIMSSLNNNYHMLDETSRFGENLKELENEMSFIDNLLARLENIDFEKGE